MLNSGPMPLLCTLPEKPYVVVPSAASVAPVHCFEIDAPHSENLEPRKSFSSALGDCEERVSSWKELRHAGGVRFAPLNVPVRSRPPVKNSGVRTLLFHEVPVVVGLVIAQDGKPSQ